MSKETRIKDLYDFLKTKGYSVYFPSQKEGECKNIYLVIKNDGSYRHISFSTDVDLYKIMIYVPRDSYSKLELTKMKVKEDMQELEPLFLPQGSETSSYYDDEYKAHTLSIEYKNYKKQFTRTNK